MDNSIPAQTLDFEVIESLRSILGDDINELFNDFLLQAPQEISQLQTLFQSNNLDELSRVAHSLKGSSGNLGVAALSNACIKLEHDARDGATASVASHIQNIEANFEVAKNSILNMLKKND